VTESQKPPLPPELAHLAAAYFHQDWMLEAPDAESVLDHFASRNRPENIAGAREGAAELLTRNLPEPELAALLRQAGLAYSPESDGRNYRDWLELVVRRLED